MLIAEKLTKRFPGEAPIIIAPLDWGLGHAARCVPLIKAFISQKQKLIIAGSGRSLALLKSEFPTLTFEELNTSEIRYSKTGFNFWELIIQLPKFLKNIRREKKAARRLFKKYRPELIISDNRYGFRRKNCNSVFITHQLSPLLPSSFSSLQTLVWPVHARIIKAFDKCLIPDFPGQNNLSGKLSHGFALPQKYEFIGPLSRFSRQPNPSTPETKKYIFIIISGPEPQRSIFFKLVLKQARGLEKQVQIVSGLPAEKQSYASKNIRVNSHLNSGDMASAIYHADYVVARSGYSTVMDLFALKKKAVLIPTPGQTEQEYLARRLSKMHVFLSRRQDNFSLSEIDSAAADFIPNFDSFIKQAIKID